MMGHCHQDAPTEFEAGLFVVVYRSVIYKSPSSLINCNQHRVKPNWINVGEPHQLIQVWFLSDAGTVLKVVTITQEDWVTEEVLLEELQVFQVRRKLHQQQEAGSYHLRRCGVLCRVLCLRSRLGLFPDWQHTLLQFQGCSSTD